jgi:purine nucleosidase
MTGAHPPLWIDTDTASDDAIALMMAFRLWRGPVLGLGVVCGNVELSQAVQNALFVRDLCGATCPVHPGSPVPLTRPLQTGSHIHGKDGMGDAGLPVDGRVPSAGHAATALIAASHAHPGLTLVTLGPLTNVALALRLDPTLADRVGACIVMGGVSDGIGNMTEVAEFNIWVDPEAAEIVFASGMPITMVGWDISRKHALISDDLAAEIRALGTDRARVTVDCTRTLRAFCEEHLGITAFDLPDPIAMAIALDPSIATATRQVAVTVACNHDATRGQVILDDRSYTPRKRSVTAVTDASRDKFLALLMDALR